MNRMDSSRSSSSSDDLRLLLCVFLTWIWFYEEFVSKTFFSIQIPHKIIIKSKIHTRWDEERRKTRKNEKSPFCSSKRTVCCFGERIQLNMLTLFLVFAIPSGNQSGIKLVNRLGLCSRIFLPVWAETASTCWVFTTKFFRSESDSGVIHRWFFRKGNCCEGYSNLFGYSI